MLNKTKSMSWCIVFFLSFALTACGESTLDATSGLAFSKSVEKLMRSLPVEEQEKFVGDVFVLIGNTLSLPSKQKTEGAVRNETQKLLLALGGKTAAEITKMADQLREGRATIDYSAGQYSEKFIDSVNKIEEQLSEDERALFEEAYGVCVDYIGAAWVKKAVDKALVIGTMLNPKMAGRPGVFASDESRRLYKQAMDNSAKMISINYASKLNLAEFAEALHGKTAYDIVGMSLKYKALDDPAIPECGEFRLNSTDSFAVCQLMMNAAAHGAQEAQP